MQFQNNYGRIRGDVVGRDLNGKELGTGIVQKKNGSYEGRYYDRFGNRKSIVNASLKVVKQRLNEAIFENNRQINIRKKIKLDEWYKIWMQSYKEGVVRESTKTQYVLYYKNHISPSLGNHYISEITQFDIRAFIKKLSDEGFGYEIKSGIKRVLSDMFNRAIENDLLSKNPAKGVQVFRKNEAKFYVLSRDNQEAFFRCVAGTFYENLFGVAINTGLRVGELAALTEDDIDFEKKLIHVSKTLSYQKYENDDGKTFHFGPPKTKSSDRYVPVNVICEQYLKNQIRLKKIIENKMPDSKSTAKEFRNLLFVTKFNTPINAQIACDAIKRVVEEINLLRDPMEEMECFSMHAFRHTFATRCFEANIKPKTIQAYLGHATLQMTMDIYTKVMQDFKQDEMQKLCDLNEDIFSKINNGSFLGVFE